MGNCFRRQDSELQLTQHDSIVHQQSNYVTSHNSVRGSVPTTPTSVVAATKPSDVDLAVQACKFLEHILVRYHAVPQSETGLGKGDVKCLRNIFVIQLVLCYLNTLVLILIMTSFGFSTNAISNYIHQVMSVLAPSDTHTYPITQTQSLLRTYMLT